MSRNGNLFQISTPASWIGDKSMRQLSPLQKLLISLSQTVFVSLSILTQINSTWNSSLLVVGSGIFEKSSTGRFTTTHIAHVGYDDPSTQRDENGM